MEECKCFPHGPNEPCTCDGCWDCKGHIVGCTCDIAWDCEHDKARALLVKRVKKLEDKLENYRLYGFPRYAEDET